MSVMTRGRLLAGAAAAAIAVPSAPSQAGTPSDAEKLEENRDLLDAFINAINDRKPERFGDLMAPTYVQHARGLGDGVAGLSAYFERSFTTAPDLRAELIKVIVEPNFIAGVIRFSGTAGGKAFETYSVDVFRVENGRLAEHWG